MSALGLCHCCKQESGELLSAVVRVVTSGGFGVLACALCSRCRLTHWKAAGMYYGVPTYVPCEVRNGAVVCPLRKP